MNYLSTLLVFLAPCYVVYGQQGPCELPLIGGQGQCKSISKCQSLLSLVNQAKKTLQEKDLLYKSHCGIDDDEPAVCCPPQRSMSTSPPPPTLPPPPQNNRCITPNFELGECINVYSCPAVLDFLTQSASQQIIDFVKRSRCSGPDEYSVCCPSSTTLNVEPRNQCASTVSALPPDYSSGCCGVDSSSSRKIFGVEAAAIDQYPWLVLLEYSNLGHTSTSCGGSLISSRYVLTAAHCLVGPNLKTSGQPTRVRLGEYDKEHEGRDCALVEAGGEDCTDGAIRIPIERIIAHPEYNTMSGPRWHDIGLIRLNRLAPYTDFIRPICLPVRDITLTITAEENFTTAGWGHISDQKTSRVKLFVDLPFVSQDRCQAAYNNVETREPLSRNQLCAGGVKGKDSCKGDSGGPLMYEKNRRHEVVGIVSFGHAQCGLKDIPAIYTHVYQYDSWIRSNISP